jgi:KDO2-lipid IV(A) lauroyltransferase
VLKDLAPVLPMYRPHRNPAVEHAMVRNRERHVEQVIPRDDVRLMVRTLRANKGVWFAPDQNFGHKNSLFSPFFGIPAATNTATSRFAAMTGARVVPFVVLRRQDRPGYDLYIEPPLENFPDADPQRDTDRINVIFEGWIRRAPAQYLWSHRRFKDRPPGETRFY